MATGEVFVQPPEERTEHLNHRINSLGCEIAHLNRQLCRAVERIQALELKIGGVMKPLVKLFNSPPDVAQGCSVGWLVKPDTLREVLKAAQVEEEEEECDAEDSQAQYIGDVAVHRAVRRVQPRPGR